MTLVTLLLAVIILLLASSRSDHCYDGDGVARTAAKKDGTAVPEKPIGLQLEADTINMGYIDDIPDVE